EGAIARAAHSTWRLGRVAAAFAVLAGAAGITFAAWPPPEPQPIPKAEIRRPVAPVVEETLPAKNVPFPPPALVPLLIPALQSWPNVPKDNAIKLVDVKAFGSMVLCQFQTSKPLRGKKPVGFNLTYCVLSHYLQIDAYKGGTEPWERVHLDRPIV